MTINDIIVKRETKIVYNFMVADYHSYFVSDLGIWIHNACYSPQTYKTKLSGNIKGKESYERVTRKKVGSDSEILTAEMKKWGLKKREKLGSTSHDT